MKVLDVGYAYLKDSGLVWKISNKYLQNDHVLIGLEKT